ncbi:kinase domain protein [Oesophagostomum dentatum]|uniref:Kinase domain protein n=1 Tax=Oesophagostomum dentatum TaxID=61180 RepID=A0A0B1TI74_OESDE|nr:kinase domain protein [Oesophagostomum dentatum]
MRKPPVVICDSITTPDKKTAFVVRIDSGPPIRKKIEDFEKLYNKLKDYIPASTSTPPKKKLLQADAKLQEKRRQWIAALSQTLLASQSNNEEVREFYGLASQEEADDSHVDLGPKEITTACPSDFEFLTTIGKGSFGRVFQVVHKETGKIYAMKVLSKEHIRKKNEVKHVMAELSVLKANINHPFLVSLHFSFQNKDKLYFVLDHLNGGELFSHLQKEKHFSESRSRFYAAQIASALGYLHKNNIIYRDLKPENLLLDRLGYLVLTDFGLCKENMTPNTTTSTFCGTPEYLAPEIILKKPYDVSVDWWCLGSVLYEMLYGLPPFYSRDHNEMYNRIVNEPLKIKRSISATSSDLITALLQKDKHKRLGSKEDFKEVKAHEFFKVIDWEKLLKREIKAPFVPQVKDERDVRNIAEDFVKIKINPGKRSEAALRVCHLVFFTSLAPTNLAMTQRDHDFVNFTYVQKNLDTE